MTREAVGFSVTGDRGFTASDLRNAAQKAGKSISDYINDAVELHYHLENECKEFLSPYTEGLKIPRWLVIQNMLLKRISEIVAFRTVYNELPMNLPEFIFTSEGMLTGKELFETLLEMSTSDELSKLKEVVRQTGFITEQVQGVMDKFGISKEAIFGTQPSDEHKSFTTFIDGLASEQLLTQDVAKKMRSQFGLTNLMVEVIKGKITKGESAKRIIAMYKSLCDES